MLYNHRVRFGRIIVWAGLLLLTAAAAAQSPRLPERADRVIEIRFGVIDPPVVRQIDITIDAPTSNQQRDPKPLECSGLVYLPAEDGAAGRLIIASDRHEHALFAARADVDRLHVDQPEPTVIISNERELLADIESLTWRTMADGRRHVYAICSLSNDPDGLPRPARRQLVRVNVDENGRPRTTGMVALRVDHLRHALNEMFIQHRVAPYRAFSLEAPGGPGNTYRWGNVEGMTFSPDGRHLLCGMRNPLVDGEAVVFVVGGVDASFELRDPLRLTLRDAMTIDLDGRGISDIAWDPVTRGYLITAAASSGPKLDDDQPYPPDDLDGAAFWWSGRRDEKPVMFAEVANMLPEAICRLGDSPWIMLGTDEGDVSEGRPERQSRLIVMYFNGLELNP